MEEEAIGVGDAGEVHHAGFTPPGVAIEAEEAIGDVASIEGLGEASADQVLAVITLGRLPTNRHPAHSFNALVDAAPATRLAAGSIGVTSRARRQGESGA